MICLAAPGPRWSNNGLDRWCRGPALRHRHPVPRWRPPAFSGTLKEIAGDIRSFAAIEVHELIFDCRGRSIADSIERLQWLVAEVIPLAAG
jgi:hypothetical protein